MTRETLGERQPRLPAGCQVDVVEVVDLSGSVEDFQSHDLAGSREVRNHARPHRISSRIAISPRTIVRVSVYTHRSRQLLDSGLALVPRQQGRSGLARKIHPTGEAIRP